MMTPAASAFSDADWMRAVLAHVPEAATVVPDGETGPFRIFAARRALLPLAHLQSVTSALTPSCLPAVSRRPAVAEAAQFLARLGMPLVLRDVPADHPVTQALVKASTHVRVLKTWQRAALDLSGTFDRWMMSNFDHKRRKEFKRLKARLAEQGALVLDELRPGGDLAAHIKAFLELEASGWKGKRGTAILNNRTAAQGLAAGLVAMHAQGRVRFWTISLDGRPVASLFALVDGGEVTLGKIGYDQRLARYSPGVLLIIEATRCLFAEPGLRLADSNAIPDHPMIDRIWRDRITCMDVVLAGAATGTVAFNVVAHVTSIKAAVRAFAKHIYLRLTGRRPS